jgi:predicted RNA-binding protein associated with RNAse of E/G family
MSWMSDGLEMKTNAGGGIGKAFSRMFSGESIFQNTYTATKDGDFIACLLDENYIWLEVYPDNENYAITIMYDDKNNLIEWYFDIAKEVGIENGVPYEDDLYLDMLIKPNGEEIVLDEDELKLALNTNQINQNDYELAYRTLEKIKKIYLNNFEYLQNFTNKLYEVFKV